MAGGLHYVVANASDKAPISEGWLEAPASAWEVEAGRSEPYLILGHVPFAAGLLVVDIDTGKNKPVSYWRDAVVESLGAPLCEVRTRAGGLHLYYRTDRPVGNRSWAGGDIRCAAGYAALWDEDAVLAALEGMQGADLVDVSAWPIRYRSEIRPGRSCIAGCRTRKTAGAGQFRRARRALKSIPCANLGYEQWLAVGMALHAGEYMGALEGGLELWREWSASDPRRYKEGECAYKWGGFDGEGGIRFGTLFWLAKRCGWQSERWRRRRVGAKKRPERSATYAGLNERQEGTLSWLYARARGKGRRLTASMTQSELAANHGCSQKTIARDLQYMKDCGYVIEVGDRTVRTAVGGYVLPVYRPTTPDREKWAAHARPKADPAEKRAGGVADICTIPGGGGGVLGLGSFWLFAFLFVFGIGPLLALVPP